MGAGCSGVVSEPLVEETSSDLVEVAVVEDVKEEMEEKMASSSKSFVLADGNITYTNEEYGFSFMYPDTWGYTEWNGGSLTLDPPGEGPNPYSDETGEGTNPMDDITVSVHNISDIVKYIGDDIITGEAMDAKPLMIFGHKASAYNGIGIVNYFNYVVQLEDSMYVVVSGPSEVSENVAAVALSLTFTE